MQKLLIKIDKKAGDETPAWQRQQPGLNNARIGNRQWEIEEADTTVEIETQYGGEIGQFAKANDERNVNYLQRNPWLQRILMWVAAVICIGFLIVLIHDVLLGVLTFKIYMDYVWWLLAALGFGQISKKFGKTSE